MDNARKGFRLTPTEKDKRIEELEKENAELKADNTEWEKASDKWKNVYELTNNQLANAKEILRLFLDANDNLEMINAQRKAEQFLNGEVEK